MANESIRDAPLPHLNRLIKVTPPRYWWVILFLFLCLSGLLFLGNHIVLYEQVSGKGVLIRPGGVFVVESPYSGQISTLNVSQSEHIETSQVIAEIRRVDIENERRRISEQMAALRGHYTKLSALKQSSAIRLKRLDLEKDIALLRARDAGLKDELDTSGRIRSPHSGHILELMVDPGDWLQRGEPMVSLEAGGDAADNLSAVLYVNAEDGRRIEQGMPVFLSFSSELTETMAFLKGEVSSVAEFSSTFEGMMTVLNNEPLVKDLSSDGPPLKVMVRLLPGKDNGTYQWTRPNDSHHHLRSGTLLKGHVSITSYRPFSISQFFRSLLYSKRS